MWPKELPKGMVQGKLDINWTSIVGSQQVGWNDLAQNNDSSWIQNHYVIQVSKSENTKVQILEKSEKYQPILLLSLIAFRNIWFPQFRLNLTHSHTHTRYHTHTCLPRRHTTVPVCEYCCTVNDSINHSFLVTVIHSFIRNIICWLLLQQHQYIQYQPIQMFGLKARKKVP